MSAAGDGCASEQSVVEDLSKVTGDALAATSTGRLTFALLDRQRIGRPQAETAFVDMTRELSTVHTKLTGIEPVGPRDGAQRDEVLQAVQSAELAVLGGRDCLQEQRDCRRARQRLAAADRQLSDLDRRLGGES